MNELTSTGHCVECGGALSQSSNVDFPYFHQPYSCIRVLSAERDEAIARAEVAEARLKKWDRAYKHLFDGLMDISINPLTPSIIEDRARQALRKGLDTLHAITPEPSEETRP